MKTNEYKKIGMGNTAEIYQYSEDKILKLFREGIPFKLIENEYNAAVKIQAELSNVPKAYDIVEYKNRQGIVYQKINGNMMLNCFKTNLFRIVMYSKRFAAIHTEIHRNKIDVNYSVKEKLSNDIDFSKDLTSDEKKRIIKYLNELPESNTLCHFDFHPGNIMLQKNEAFVIDWMTACTGDQCADVARTMLLMKTGELMHVSRLTCFTLHICMKKIGKEYFKEYKRITGITETDVNQWMLPVAAARLSEWLTEHERRKLIKYIRKTMQKQGI